MAGGLGGERPSPSAKVVDVKRCRLFEVLVIFKRLGKNGRLDWYKDVEGERPYFVKNHGQYPAPKPTKSLAVAWSKGVGSRCSERHRDLTTFPVDAGASPRKAYALASEGG